MRVSHMKTLYLVRHARSSRDDPGVADRDRPLEDRGKRDARRMGKRLARRHVEPDLILSSPALRALRTAQIMAKELGYKRKDIVVDDRLYARRADVLLNVIRKLGDRSKRVMLFGHNPELTDLAHRFSNDITHLPTAAVAKFKFDSKSWSRVGETAACKASLNLPEKSKRRTVLS